MARVEHTCTGCVPIDASIIDVYVTLVETNKSVTNAETGRSNAEAARVVAETERTATFTADHGRAVADHSIAEQDHALAGTDHSATAAATASANAAAELANLKAALVQQRLDTADADHTRAEGDHSTAASDHSKASSDHTTAQSDHATAGTDHTRAESDHSTAASDHTTAAGDHTTAEADHALYEADHAVMEGYDTRLGTVETEVTGLEHKVDDFKSKVGNAIQDTDGDSMSVCDGEGNVIANVDGNGIKSVDVEGAGRKLSEMPIPWYNDALYVTDGNGNVVAKIDANGIQTVGFDSSGKFSQKFKAIQVSGNVEASAFLSTPTVQIEKDILLSALIDGTIEKVQVGLGKTAGGYGYWAHWLEIDSTTVKLYRYVTESQLIDTFTHGLTLTDKTTVVVESKIVGNTKETTLKIFNDLGGVFTQSLSTWGLGRGFVLNQNASSALSVSLSLMPMSIVKKVWLFGDSYINFYANNRWPYYFAQLGLTDFFSNNQPGLTPENALASLEYLLALGYVPSILVWCLGMNGPGTEDYSGGVYTINPDQKRVLDRVLAICKTYGIIPVLATIPTVPSGQKTGYSNYVRSLGVRYIDFAEAVGADSAGNWNEGLLSDDNVHPSTLGAIVLASRAFVDCPELSVID